MKEFEQIEIPVRWKYLGTNHTTDINDETGEERITVKGIVFSDQMKNIKIRICFIISSERYLVVEKDYRGKYNTVIDCKTLPDLNYYLKQRYDVSKTNISRT